MSQLPLPFTHRPRFGPDAFIPAPSNAGALAAVTRWPDWPDRVLVLTGPEGAGKSHLAGIWAARAGAALLRPADIAGDVAGLARRNALIENADRDRPAEAPLFHLLNLVRENGTSLLITARSPPGAWSLATPDLLSRLRLAPAVAIAPPDDGLMRAVLAKLFADRQLAVDGAVIDYLALRLERSLDAAAQAVAELDRASLDARRPITRSFAGALLGDLRPEED